MEYVQAQIQYDGSNKWEAKSGTLYPINVLPNFQSNAAISVYMLH